jgi:hypothetical protein
MSGRSNDRFVRQRWVGSRGLQRRLRISILTQGPRYARPPAAPRVLAVLRAATRDCQENGARVGKSGPTSHPHLHIQVQTLPTGVADITTIDGPQMQKTLHTYPLLFPGVSLLRGGVETRPIAVDPRRGDSVRPTP